MLADDHALANCQRATCETCCLLQKLAAGIAGSQHNMQLQARYTFVVLRTKSSQNSNFGCGVSSNVCAVAQGCDQSQITKLTRDCTCTGK